MTPLTINNGSGTVKTTVGVILMRENKILLTKRSVSPEKGKWCFPGGHMDIGEDPIEAIKRETKEETGLGLENIKFLEYFNEYLPQENHHALLLVFSAIPLGEPKLTEEVSEFGWFSPSKALSKDMAFFHKDIIKKYFEENNLK